MNGFDTESIRFDNAGRARRSARPARTRRNRAVASRGREIDERLTAAGTPPQRAENRIERMDPLLDQFVPSAET